MPDFGAIDWYEMLAQREPGSFGFGQRLAFLAGLALLIAGLNLYAPANPPLNVRILASAAIALAALPTWLWLAGIDRNLPLMPFFGMVFSTYFTVPLFVLHDYLTLWSMAEMPSRLIAGALKYILIGLACVLAGYYGPQNLLIGRALPRVTMRWRRKGLLRVGGAGFGLLGIAVYLYARGAVSDNLGMLVEFGGDLCMVGMALLFAMQLCGALDRASKLFLWMALVPIRLLIGLTSGLTSQGLIVMLLLIYVYSALRRRIPWMLILAGGLTFIVLRPVESALRMATWNGRMSNLSQLERSRLLLRMVGDSLVPMMDARGAGGYDYALDVSTRRLGTDVLTFAAVLHDTPGFVPYWNGATYYPMLFKLAPRFIYPDKPKEVTGQTFGHRYGLLSPDNFTTSYNLPQLIEAYINFGPLGVVVIMFLFGAFYRAVLAVLVHPGMGFGALVAGVYLSIMLLQIESATSLTAGNVLWGFVYVALLNLLIQSGELEHPSMAARLARD